MPKDRDFDFEDVLPESWTDALQEFIGTLSSGLRLSLINLTTVRASHDANGVEEQVGVGIAGLWRWRTSPYDVAVSGGAGTKDIFVVAPTANKFTGNKDETERAWELRVVPGGETPAGVAAYRKIGEVAWSGTEVTALAQLGPESVNGPQIRSNALSNNGDISWSREASGAWVPQLKANSVGANEVAPGVIGDSEIADALKPSKGAATATEALRAIGSTGSTVVAGNDSRLTDERTPKDNSVTRNKLLSTVRQELDRAGKNILYNWSTGTSVEVGPGSGNCKFDNSVYASVTKFMPSTNTLAAIGVKTVLEALPTGTFIIVTDPSTTANRAVFKVSGTLTDKTDWVIIPVTYVTSGGSAFTNAKPVIVQFFL